MPIVMSVSIASLAAQACGLPLYAYLGGEKREMETDITIGIGEASWAAERALVARAMGLSDHQGQGGAKPVGGFPVGDGNPPCRRCADHPAHRCQPGDGTGSAAVRSLRAFEELDIEFCAQPCRADDLQGMAYVHQHLPFRSMADESIFSAADALEVIRQDAASYFNIKLSKSAGIAPWGEQIGHVAAAGFRPWCMVGCMSESRLGITAAAHFACACPVIRFFDLDSCLEHAEDPIQGGVRHEGGVIRLPDDPGDRSAPGPELPGEASRGHIARRSLSFTTLPGRPCGPSRFQSGSPRCRA